MAAAVARTLVIGVLLIAAAGCGYGASTTFEADGSVVVGLKFLLPKSLLQEGPNVTVHGFSQADIDKANAELAAKYPGAKIAKVTEGDETGVQLTIPFKTEKEAFKFLTQPTNLSPSAASSGGSTIDVGNTGGIFVSATHTTSGQTDTYTFKTQSQPLASPSPGSQEILTPDQLGSIFTITFSLTVPNEITSAPGALFTFDRKTAIWKLSYTKAQTLTATTQAGATLTGAVSNRPSGPNAAALIGIGLAAIALGFFLGLISPWRLLHGQVTPPPPPAA